LRTYHSSLLTKEFIDSQKTVLEIASAQEANQAKEAQVIEEGEQAEAEDEESEKSEVEDGESEAEAVHHGYVCDGCGEDPIVGIRYKCAICDDFDFCEDCEENKVHGHVFLKIRSPTAITVKVLNYVPEVKCPDCPEILCEDCPGYKKAQEAQSESLLKVEEEENLEKAQSEEIVPVKVEEKVEVMQSEKYSPEVQETAERLLEIFSEASKNELLEFVSHTPTLKFEELVESYLLQL